MTQAIGLQAPYDELQQVQRKFGFLIVKTDSIGGGHVWIGTDAVQIGLADRLGSFNDAVKSAAKKAKLKEYKVVEYPEVIDPLKSLLSESSDKVKAYYTKQELGENYYLYQQMKKVISSSGLQARMPFEAVIK